MDKEDIKKVFRMREDLWERYNEINIASDEHMRDREKKLEELMLHFDERIDEADDSDIIDELIERLDSLEEAVYDEDNN